MIARPAGSLPGCTVVVGDPGVLIEEVVMDSRAARPGSLFVAIRGGHAHVASAVAAGASAVLVSEGPRVGAVVLEAADTVAALQAIGAANRTAADGCTVVAVTGSSGKTSTKDVLAAICAPQRATVAALEGHNNEIGLPFTLTRIERTTKLAVCELSMRGPGQIAELVALARPQVAVITNVGEAHLELLGSREAIAAAKAEVLDGVDVAVLPAGEPLLAPHIPDGLAVVTFGEEPSADVRIVERAVRADGMSVLLDVRGTRVSVDSALVGAHHARNLAAAFAVVSHLGLDLARCADAARAITLQRWRSEPHALPGGGVIVNDAYNANPSATVAALAALAERGSGRLVAVLGAMRELGPSAPALHREVGEAARELGFAVIVAVGDGADGYLEGAGDRVEGVIVEERSTLVDRLVAIVRPGDRVLVKASRSVGLEHVAKDLATALAKVSAT